MNIHLIMETSIRNMLIYAHVMNILIIQLIEVLFTLNIYIM